MNLSKNRLSKEESLYLQQHANNPVDWYPWGNEAFTVAKETNRPILLSIGYSACHWCHVMAHESFEDQETAEIMNRHFVNIKVDREERPDLDRIYQTALQLLTGRPGGWPLTLFLTPNDLTPFFGSTYFPKRAGFGRASFRDVLLKIVSYYQQYQNDIKQISEKVQHSLRQLSQLQVDEDKTLDEKPLTAARKQLASEFDNINGGFGHAPKFPYPTYIERLLHFWYASKKQDHEAIAMTITSLTKMGEGGIYDQLGGGFFRYSVDAAWMIPHFEKMLYDNGQLLPLYANAYLLVKNSLYKNIVEKTAQWAMLEMQSAEGGYFATIAADSEGVEGKFYDWDRNEVKNILSEPEYAVVEKHFGLNLPANFENHWHLYVAQNLDTIATELQASKEEINLLLQSAIQKLFLHREKRIHPERDKKIITAWNALMIKGMIIAGKTLGRVDFIHSAQKALDFIYHNLWKERRLFASYNQGKVKFPGYLDDYAFLLDALIHFLELKMNYHYLQFAVDIADTLCQFFVDEKNGGFFFTAHDHEALIQRPKPLMDEATPSGNGVAAYCFLRLGHLMGEQKYLDIAEQTLQLAKPAIESFPAAYGSLLMALEEYLHPPTFIMICGTAEKLVEWQKVYNQMCLPQHLCFAIPKDEPNLPDVIKTYIPKDEITTYACQGRECFAKFTTLEEFKNYLNTKV